MLKKYSIPIILLLVFLSILLLVFNLTKKSAELELIEITPNPTTNSIRIQESVTLQFENITEEEKLSTNVLIYPRIDFSGEWSETKLTLKPDLYWDTEKTYTVLIYIDNAYFDSFSFKVVGEDELTEEEKNIIYNAQISELSEQYSELYKDRPWLEKLPIISDEYVIIFDFENEKIRIRLLDTEGLTSDEIEFFKQKTLKELVDIGVPQEYEIEVILD